MHAQTYPPLDDGLVTVATDSRRPGALYEVVAGELCERDGVVYWLDARNAAVTHALYDSVPSKRSLRRVHVARAFTAYQHHTLVRQLVRRATDRTALVVAPNVVDLYRDDDVPEFQSDGLAETTLAILADLGDALDVPVVVTTVADDEYARLAAELATQQIETRETPLGTAFESEDFETQAYWDDGFWQTTIPYWVELFGAVGECRPAEPTPGPATLEV